jgi:endonuclease/exonuclease/phosphatase family metal-dependent hydrolase
MDAKGHKFDRNREEILRFIGETDSDIVCIQEYHGKGKTLYEPLQQNKEMLGAESYYYESYFNPRYQQLTGLAIFTKLKAVNKGKLIFEGSRTFGIFTDLLTGNDTIRVFNIHLASIQLKPSDIDFVVNPGQNQDEMGIHALRIYDKLNEAFKLRERQMEQIVKELENCKYPVILAGDFNDTPTSYTYRNTKALLEDTFREKGTGFSITYAGRIPFLRIDYIMKSKEFKTKKYRRHMVEYSDHYPVAAEVYR